LAKVLYYDDILSLHTRNVNPPCKKCEPPEKINLYRWGKSFDNQYIIKYTVFNDVKG
jgi:hypothetical protein